MEIAVKPNQSELLSAVLELPESDRLAIAEALLSSLPDEVTDVDSLDDAAFEQELLRRSQEMQADDSAGVSWSELKKMR